MVARHGRATSDGTRTRNETYKSATTPQAQVKTPSFSEKLWTGGSACGWTTSNRQSMIDNHSKTSVIQLVFRHRTIAGRDVTPARAKVTIEFVTPRAPRTAREVAPVYFAPQEAHCAVHHRVPHPKGEPTEDNRATPQQ